MLKFKRKGFTLLELIVVIVILGLLAVLAIPTFKNVIDNSKLKTAEVTAGSVAREAIALSGFNSDLGLMIKDDVEAAVNDLPGRASAAAGVYAAVEETPLFSFNSDYNFSGHPRSVSARLSTDGRTLGVAVGVPDAGCAFARTDQTTVKAWSVRGMSLANCNGAAALLDEDDFKLLKPPPMPQGLGLSFGCSPDGTGWDVSWKENTYVDIYVNGIWIGAYMPPSECIPGKQDDTITVIERPGAGTTPVVWPGAPGDVYEDGEITIPTEPTNPQEPTVSAPISVTPGQSVIIKWPAGSVPPGSSVEIGRGPVGGPYTPIVTAPNNGSHYDTPGGGDYEYVVQPVKDGQPVGEPIPVEVEIVKLTPLPQEEATAVTVLGNTAVLTWGAVANTPDAPLDGYRIYRAVGNGDTWELAKTNTSAETSFQDPNLSPGKYCYRISSFGLGGESEKTTPVCATITVGWQDANGNESFFGADQNLNNAQVAIEGDLAVGVTTFGNKKPQIYTKEASGWVKNTFSVYEYLSSWGESLAIQDGAFYIGASSDSTRAGEVYEYKKVNGVWVKTSTFIGSDAIKGQKFGSHLDINGNTLATTAPAVNGSGVLYLYERTNASSSWPETETSKIVMPDSGGPITALTMIDSTTVAVGFKAYDGASADTGIVRIFKKTTSGWTQTSTVESTSGIKGFGTALASTPGKLAVGGSNNVAVDIYSVNSSGVAALENTIVKPNVTAGLFGASLSMNGPTLVIGSSTDSGIKALTGAAYVYAQTGNEWALSTKLVPVASASTITKFGSGVAVDGSNVMVASGYSTTSKGGFYIKSAS